MDHFKTMGICCVDRSFISCYPTNCGPATCKKVKGAIQSFGALSPAVQSQNTRAYLPQGWTDDTEVSKNAKEQQHNDCDDDQQDHDENAERSAYRKGTIGDDVPVNSTCTLDEKTEGTHGVDSANMCHSLRSSPTPDEFTRVCGL